MSAAKHTPGPWQVHMSHVYGSEPTSVMVAQVLSADPHHMADRCLIAAAPELLEALEAVTDSLEAELQARYPVEAEGHSPYPDMKRRFDRDMAEVAAARAAIAKARGEQ